MNFKHDNTKIIKDIIYKSVNGTDLGLDIYMPAGTFVRPVPVVVYIHGGRWFEGTRAKVKKSYRGYVLRDLVADGYAVVSISYRLTSPSGPHFPAPMEDCKDAVRWLKKNGAGYGLDTGNIGLWGSSAGAHLAMMAAYAGDGLFAGTPELEGYSSEVRYVVDNFGPADLVRLMRPGLGKFSLKLLKLFAQDLYDQRKERLTALLGSEILRDRHRATADMERYSPINHIDSSTVPTLILHGSRDRMVNWRQSARLAGKLGLYGVPHEKVVYAGAGHGFTGIRPEQLEDIRSRTLRFIKNNTL